MRDSSLVRTRIRCSVSCCVTSINLLNLFIQSNENKQGLYDNLHLFQIYELDTNALLAKAAFRIATNYEILDKKDKEEEFLFKALRYSRPNTQIQASIYKNLGTLFFQKNNLPEAIKYYKKSYLISPSPTINYAISVCYLKLNDLINYEKYLKKSISVISSYNISPFKTYGQFLELSKNDLKGAVKYYKIATLLENSPEPYILLATTYLKLNQIDNAYKTVSNGLYGFPENSSLLYLQGTILLNKKKKNDGINILIKVVSKNDSPNDIKIEACHILVSIFLNQKDLTNAAKYNDYILMIDPKNKEALVNRNYY